MSKTNKTKDAELWEKVKATVKPIRANRADLFAQPPAKQEVVLQTDQKSRPTRKIRPQATSHEPPITLNLAPITKQMEPSIAKKIAKGRIAFDGRIDLHGMTQVQAHNNLLRFVEYSYRHGRRTILVITGKGSGGEGVLRQAVPQWMATQEFRSYISGIQQAHISHGGSGAFYVRLRDGRKGHKS